MAQFRAYRLPGGPLVLDLQSDYTRTPTRIVAPLLPTAAVRPLTRLEPLFDIGGERLALHLSEMAAIPAGLLSGEPAADLRAEDYSIRRAMDLLFSGF